MNRETSNLRDRKEFRGAVQNLRLSWADKSRSKEIILGTKVGLLFQGHFSLGDTGVYQAHYINSANPVTIDWLV